MNVGTCSRRTVITVLREQVPLRTATDTLELFIATVVASVASNLWLRGETGERAWTNKYKMYPRECYW